MYCFMDNFDRVKGGINLLYSMFSRSDALTSLYFHPTDGRGNSQIKNLQYKRPGLERWSLRVAAIDATCACTTKSLQFSAKNFCF